MELIKFSKPPILWESSLGNFMKGSRNLHWKSSVPPTNNSAETFWHVQTNLRLQTFLLLKKMEFLFTGISIMEQQLLFDAPGVMKDKFFLGCISAYQSEVPKELLDRRLKIVCSIFDFPEIGTPLIKQIRGTARYRIRLIQNPIRKAKKFSGWVRNSSAVGSKRQTGSRPEPGTFKWDVGDEIDYFHILTVGEFSMNQEIKFLSLKSPIRTKQ